MIKLNLCRASGVCDAHVHALLRSLPKREPASICLNSMLHVDLEKLPNFDSAATCLQVGQAAAESARLQAPLQTLASRG